MNPPRPGGYRWIVLLALSALNACNIGVFFLTPPIAPFLQADLAITRTEVGLLMAALLVGASLTSIPGGWLADRSVRWTMVACELLIAASLVLFSSADSLELAGLATLGMGLGGGASLTTMIKAVANWFPYRERATALGLYFAGGSLGTATVAIALPALSEALGWRQSILIVTAVIVTTAVASLAIYRERPDSREGPPASSDLAIRRTESKSLFYNIAVLGLFSIIFGAPQYAVATYMILYLKDTLSYSVVDAGLLLAVVQGSSLFGRIGWGIVSDRAFGGNRKAVLMISSALFTVCLSGLAGGLSGQSTLIALAFFMGVSGFSWYGIWTALVAESVRGSSATLIGVAQFLSYVGVIFGPPLFGYVVDSANSYTPAWVGAALMAGLSTLLVIMIKDTRQEAKEATEAILQR